MSDVSSSAIDVHASNVRHIRSRAASRLTNGRELLPDHDGRSAWARYMRDTLKAMVSHLGGDPSEPQLQICRRTAALAAEAVFMESRFANLRAAGQTPPLEEVALYVSVSNAMRRLAKDIGLARVPKDVSDLASLFTEETDNG